MFHFVARCRYSSWLVSFFYEHANKSKCNKRSYDLFALRLWNLSFSVTMKQLWWRGVTRGGWFCFSFSHFLLFSFFDFTYYLVKLELYLRLCVKRVMQPKRTRVCLVNHKTDLWESLRNCNWCTSRFAVLVLKSAAALCCWLLMAKYHSNKSSRSKPCVSVRPLD